MKRQLRRAAAFILAIVMAGNVTACSDKEVPGVNSSQEANPYSLKKLEEMPEPTTFPATGYLGVETIADKTMDKSGVSIVAKRNAYLPVIVDENHVVYGKLDSLGDFLDFPVYFDRSNAKAVLNKTSIYMTIGSNTATYSNAFFDEMIDMGSSPMLYEEDWYVPLDAFVTMADLKGDFSIVITTAGTFPLLLYRNRETVLDRLAEFYQDRATYDFKYSDLGYSGKNLAYMDLGATLSTYLRNLFSLDTYAVAYTFSGIDEILDAKYLNKFADSMLEMDDQLAQILWDISSRSYDDAWNIMGAVVYGEQADLESAVEIMEHELSTHNPGPNSMALITLEDASEYASIQMAAENASDQAKGMGQVSNLLTVVGWMISYGSLATRFDSGDEWMKSACEEFLERKKDLEQLALPASLYQSFADRVEAYGSSGISGFRDKQKQWWQENLVNVTANGLAFLGDSFFGFVTMASGLWSTFTSGALDDEEAFLTAVQGILYETDAMAAFEQIYKETLVSVPKTWTMEDEQTFRYILCNAVKACYVSRYYGCIAAEYGLTASQLARQKELNTKLEYFMADFSDTGKRFGLMPSQLANLTINGAEAWQEVIFTLTELTGQVLSWEDEQPVPGVKMEIKDEDSTLLVECMTDEEGRFDVSFDMAGKDSMDTDSAAVRTMTAELNYKKYPVVLQAMEIVSGRKYQVNGLHVGERTTDRLIYLDGARTADDGKVMILGREIDLGENSFAVDVSDYQGGTAYTAYFSVTGEFQVSEENAFILRDGVTFGSFYTANMPEGGVADTLMRITGAYGNVLPESVLNREMHTEQEINDYVEAYREINDMDPVLVITTVNSEVKAAEPTMINPD
ncbi:MAG: hypothetical protein LIO92_08930 [Clostridiales bacterium]|nr:hypothetical protein [Clostridiales bacterium]